MRTYINTFLTDGQLRAQCAGARTTGTAFALQAPQETQASTGDQKHVNVLNWGSVSVTDLPEGVSGETQRWRSMQTPSPEVEAGCV